MWTSSESHQPYCTRSFGFLPSYCPVCLILLSLLHLAQQRVVLEVNIFCLWCICMCVWVCAQRQEDDIRLSLPFSSETRALPAPGVHVLSAGVAADNPSIPFSVPTNQCCDYKRTGPCLAFLCGTGAQTLVLMVVQQALWITELCLQRLLPANV